MGAATDYRALARRVRSLPDEIVRAGAKELQLEIMGRLKADTGGDQVLSGTARRSGRRMKLATTVTQTTGRAFSSATVKASPPKGLGMWAWIERGTQRRRMGKRHMYVYGHWYTGPWEARGSPAKHTFTEAVKHGTPAAERAMRQVWEQAQNG